jgi:hypothetical protein
VIAAGIVFTAFALGDPTPIDADAYAGARFLGSEAQLRRALADPGMTRRIRRVGFSAPHVDRNCHTQAISVSDAKLLTSCVDRRRGVGWLQIYDRDATSQGDGRTRREARRRRDAQAVDHAEVGKGVRLHDRRWPHAAVGQGLVGVGDQAGEMLVPIGHEPMDLRGRHRASRLELRDGDGEVVCAIDNPREGGIAATALVATKDAVFAIGISYTELLVWRIDGVEPGSTECRASLVFARPGVDAAGAGWRRYQGIAALVDRRGDVFLFGGRKHRLDVWRLADFGATDMRVLEVGTMDWRPAAMPIRGVFHEGLGVEPTPRGLRIWAAPRDFWRGSCLPARADRRCMPTIYYVDQHVDPHVDPRVAGPAMTRR